MSSSTLPSVACKTALSKSSLPGLDYTFNPYVGCSHGCLYCYVPDVMRSFSLSSKWGLDIRVKEHLLDRLKDDLKKVKPGIVGISTITDPYQPIEQTLQITRQAIVILKKAGFPISIQTKSPLVTRDLDIIRNEKIEVGITITSMKDSFQRLFEPGASLPFERKIALETLSHEGIKTWIFYGPIISGFNDSDEDIMAIAEFAAKNGSRLLYDRLNLKPMLQERLRQKLTDEQLIVLKKRDSDLYSRIICACLKYDVKCEPAFG